MEDHVCEGQVLQIVTAKLLLMNDTVLYFIITFIVTKSKRLWSLQEIVNAIQ